MKHITARTILFSLLCACFTSMDAQNKSYWLRGHVRDGFTNAGVDKAKVYLLNTDSLVIDSTETRGDYFSFNLKRNGDLKSCIIRMSHPDYNINHSTHSLKYVGKNAFFDLPTIYVKRKNTFMDQSLQEVTVTATKVKMFYRGDTIVYNADAYNVAKGSMLDALIRQMPGTEINRQGEIFVNGRKVENLLLNGKDFFRGNNRLMLENLPYYTVKEIKVYDMTSEKAMVLHDENAKKDFVMDVNLKKEYSKGYMVNTEVGAGTQHGYLGRLFGLRFTDASRYAIVGGMNNLNMSDYSFSGNAIDNGERNGRTTNNLLTAELMTEHKRNKNVLMVELKRKKSEHGADEFQETFHNDGSTFSTSQNSQIGKNLGVSLSNKYTLKTPIWLESTTALRLNDKEDDINERYYESGIDTRSHGLAMLDSLFHNGIALNEPSMINARKKSVVNNMKDYGASQSFSVSKNLYSSDIIEFDADVDYSKQEYDTDRFNSYLYWKPEYAQNDITESVKRPNTHIGVKTGVSYKLTRLLYNTDIKFFAGYGFNRDKDKESIVDVASSVLDAMNSYDRRMTENKYTFGTNYHFDERNSEKKLRTEIRVDLPVSVIDRSTSYLRYSLDTCLVQTPIFFEPSLTFSRSKWIGQTINKTKWFVTASTSLKSSLPDATQLVTLPLTSDRINIFQGNASLKSPTALQSSVKWKYTLSQSMAYIEQTLSYANYINRIVNTYRYDAGIYYHSPQNINGTWNIDFKTRGQHFFKLSKKKITLQYNVDATYHRMKNYISDGLENSSQIVKNDELHLYSKAKLTSGFNKVYGGLILNVDWRKLLDNNYVMGYRDTWEYSGELFLTINLPKGIDFETECSAIKRTGYSNQEVNDLNCVWNAYLSKSIINGSVDLKFKVIDILHQYKSVAYVINERGIRETRSMTLPSYMLFCASYKFNKQPKK